MSRILLFAAFLGVAFCHNLETLQGQLNGDAVAPFNDFLDDQSYDIGPQQRQKRTIAMLDSLIDKTVDRIVDRAWLQVGEKIDDLLRPLRYMRKTQNAPETSAPAPIQPNTYVHPPPYYPQPLPNYYGR